MATITEWLASLGMSEYAQRFADNRIDDVSILRDLTDQDLKNIGIPLGHRRKMLRRSAPPPVKCNPNLRQSRRTTQSGAKLTVVFTDLVGSTALPARTRSIKGMMPRKDEFARVP